MSRSRSPWTTGDGRADNAYFPGAAGVGPSGRVVPANGTATGVASFLFNLADIPDNVDFVDRRVVLNARMGMRMAPSQAHKWSASEKKLMNRSNIDSTSM